MDAVSTRCGAAAVRDEKGTQRVVRVNLGAYRYVVIGGLECTKRCNQLKMWKMRILFFLLFVLALWHRGRYRIGSTMA